MDSGGWIDVESDGEQYLDVSDSDDEKDGKDEKDSGDPKSNDDTMAEAKDPQDTVRPSTLATTKVRVPCEVVR